MNKSLGFASQRKLIYFPALRPKCGNSLIAAIMVGQFEYWFSSYEKGFYKFLEPCEHPAYKAGDSWVEELGISAREFRTAFDHIGTKYKSKQALDRFVLENPGECPFQGKMYLVYTDRINHLTYYQRNHTVADQVIESVVNAEPALNCHGCKDRSIDAEVEQMPVPNFGNFAKRSSATTPTSSRIYNETEITTEITAAAKKRGESLNSNHQDKIELPIAAAAKKQTVALIGDELTSCQKSCIAEKLEYLKIDADKSTLRDEIEAALLDKNAFKKTGNDFAYKLNAILKQIKQGAWSRPADILQEEEKEAKKQASIRNELQYAINNAATEITHWERMCSMHKAAGAKQHQKTAEKLIGNAKRAYQEALLALQSFDKQEGQQCG